MKISNFFLSMFAILLLLSCNNNDEKSDAYGNFEADEIIFSAETAGKINKLLVNEGDEVRSDQLLCIIDTTQLSLKIEQLFATMSAIDSKTQDVEIQLDVLRKKKDNIIREKTRIARLFDDSAATRKQYDDIIGELDIVEKQIVASKSQLNSANRGILSEKNPLSIQIKQLDDQIEKSKIRANKDYTILRSYISEGEYVVPGKPLIKAADMKNMILRVYIPGSMLSKVKIGNTAQISIDISDGKMKTYHGVIFWISGKAEFTPKIIQTKDERVNLVYALKIKVINDGSLKIGMPAEANFNN